MPARRSTDGARLKLALALGASLLLAALGARPRAQSFDLLLTRAASAAGAGQPQAALGWLDAAIGFDPALASLHLPAAQLALQAGDSAALRSHLLAAPPEARTSSAYACLQARLPDNPSQPLLPAPATCAEGTHPPEIAQLGIPSHAELIESAQALRSRLASDPQDVTGWERLAAMTELIEPSETEEAILEAYRHFPAGSEVLDGLWAISHQDDPSLTTAERAGRTGQLLAAHNDWTLAGAAWARAVELEPDFPQAMAYLGLATARTGGEGLPLLLVAAAEAPDDPLVRSLLGQYWLSIGDAEASLRELEHAHRLDSGNPAITASLAAALARSGRLPEAADAYRRAALQQGQDPAFWLLLAEFSLRYDYQVDSLGLEAARNAAALAPKDPGALSALGMANALTGDAAAGERLLQESLALDPSSAVGWYRYAMVLLDLGRSEEAQGALASAAALDPSGIVGGLAEASLLNIGDTAP